jgi:ParB family chromosome partitioning protein
LKLPPSIRKLVESGDLTQGHARALLALEDPVRAAALARRVVKEGWSVREVERRVAGPATKRRGSVRRSADPVVQALEGALQDHLQTRVAVREGRGGKGVVEIQYHGVEDFGRLFELITGRSVSEVVE